MSLYFSTSHTQMFNDILFINNIIYSLLIFCVCVKCTTQKNLWTLQFSLKILRCKKKRQFTFLPFIFHGRFYILIGYIEKHLDITKVFQRCFHAVWLHNQRVENTFFLHKENFKTICFRHTLDLVFSQNQL